MADQETIGYVVTVYSGRGLPPERSDFEDKVKAEKAFTDAKFAATLWQSRPPALGLGWVKLKEKETPPPAPPAPPAAAKPAVPAAAAKPASAVVAEAAPKPAAPAPAAAAEAITPAEPLAAASGTTPAQAAVQAAPAGGAPAAEKKPGTAAGIPKKPIDPLNDSTPNLKPPPTPAQIQKARMLKLMIEYLSAYSDGNFKAHSENLGKFLGATPGKNKADMLAAIEAIEGDFDKGEMEWSTPAREFVKLAKDALK